MLESIHALTMGSNVSVGINEPDNVRDDQPSKND